MGNACVRDEPARPERRSGNSPVSLLHENDSFLAEEGLELTLLAHDPLGVEVGGPTHVPGGEACPS
eukprot:8146160-Lingulodinium_polyedra.AAC.1